MAKKKPPKLYVIFDTNVLYTQVASDLVRKEVQRIVSENSSHLDLDVSWYLPKIVVDERKYQMMKKALNLIPGMQKLERLLGHKFGVGDDTLELHVNKAVDDEIKKYNFKVIDIDTTKIDWVDIIECSVNRDPPFEPSEKEKGFRDSIIAHSFFQLLKSSPVTPAICRLALVSEDKVLREYVELKTSSSNNVRILSSLDELESLINTIVSTIPEDLAAELATKASNMFFQKGNDKTFYYRNNIGEKIREQFASELSDTIIEGHIRNDKTWWINPPILVRKEKQRIYWHSTVEPEFEIYHFEKVEPQPSGVPNFLGQQAAGPSSAFALSQADSGLLGSLGGKKVVDISSRDKFGILWSTNLSQAQNLTSPKLLSIHYIGNNVNDKNS